MIRHPESIDLPSNDPNDPILGAGSLSSRPAREDLEMAVELVTTTTTTTIAVTRSRQVLVSEGVSLQSVHKTVGYGERRLSKPEVVDLLSTLDQILDLNTIRRSLNPSLSLGPYKLART